MDAFRFKKVEDTLVIHERRHDDSERRHSEAEARMAATETLVTAIHKSTATQERMIEVGENIILALGWAAKVAKWILTMVAFFAALYQAVKVVAAKILAFKLTGSL